MEKKNFLANFSNCIVSYFLPTLDELLGQLPLHGNDETFPVLHGSPIFTLILNNALQWSTYCSYAIVITIPRNPGI